MGKLRELDTDYNYDDAIQAFLDDIDIEDADFFEKPEPKQTRRKARRSRDARRRIEEYWDDRRLADSLDEYYYHTGD